MTFRSALSQNSCQSGANVALTRKMADGTYPAKILVRRGIIWIIVKMPSMGCTWAYCSLTALFRIIRRMPLITRILPCEEGIIIHQRIHILTNSCDILLVLGVAQYAVDKLCDVVHLILLKTSCGDCGSTEAKT